MRFIGAALPLAFTTKHRLLATGDHKDLQAALLETLPAAEEGQVTSSVNIAPHGTGAAPGAAA
jgi:hypothetical protein